MGDALTWDELYRLAIQAWTPKFTLVPDLPVDDDDHS